MKHDPKQAKAHQRPPCGGLGGGVRRSLTAGQATTCGPQINASAPPEFGDLFDIDATSVDTVSSRRLKAVYGCLNHGKYCPRYQFYAQRIYASRPGEAGCLKNLGCKGLSTMSLCTRHGWNAQQPQNKTPLSGAALGADAEGAMLVTNAGVTCGGNCLVAGAPCMGCTEKGYPDAFVPFVAQR